VPDPVVPGRQTVVDDDSPLQQPVDEYFDSVAGYWRDVYRQPGVQGLSYRLRMETVLAWIDESRPRSATAALDVGCGAGMMTVELARRGLHVEGVDGSSSMLELTEKAALETGVAEDVTVRLADVHDLPYADNSFQVVVALGVIPWLHTPKLAVDEMARVLAPGGVLILTADNRARLNWLTEPRENLLVSPIKLARRKLRRWRGHEPTGAASHLHLPRQIDRALLRAGLRPMHRRTVGFGPFTFLGQPVLSDRPALRLHRGLQTLADRGIPGLRSMGWHYVVAASKPETPSLP
jgi:ubiquinone/menaquinone biosynthesis C-methylase UbiE